MKIKGRGSWSVEDMKKAKYLVLDAGMSDRKVADRVNLPKSSLQDKISETRKGSQVQVSNVSLH
jgi:DNA-binding transcriptional regulator LsrR (DeoR family)